MGRIADGLRALVVTLWVGSLWTIGFMVAPALFAHAGDRVLAGELAGRLFALESWLGLGCCLFLLGLMVARAGGRALKSGVFWLLLAMGGLVAAGHFGVQPILAALKAEAWPREVMQSVLRDRFASWHGISSGLYVVEAILGLALVVLQGRLSR
ncbi:MAG: DUF4149 domain-containing protein [Rhodocyclaceae bacterium]|jgi:hypothetical protein|nr:DUF4149 domain-containing protein [Rhodocyclaceae bacterium]